MIDSLGVTIVDNRPPPPPTEFEVSLEAFKKDVATAINKNSMEAYVGVPDFILAEFMWKTGTYSRYTAWKVISAFAIAEYRYHSKGLM